VRAGLVACADDYLHSGVPDFDPGLAAAATAADPAKREWRRSSS
jgi:hypothetical protein